MDKYICPVCKTSLSKEEYESALGILEERDSELARREEDLEEREKDFQREKTQLILKAKSAKQEGIEEGVQTERKRANRALAEKREEIDRQARQLEKREKELKAQKAELIQKAKDALEKGIDQGIQTERKRTERVLAGQAGTITKLEEKIRQLEKGSTPQTEGLEFEDTLAERLEQEFPSDEVVHHGKSGDVMHVVKHDGQKVGCIIYECKRTALIQAAHVAQAYDAKQDREADFAVLVTTGKRKGFAGLDEDEGVLIVAPLGVVPLVRMLRQSLIQLFQARLTEDERAKAAQHFVKYLTGPQFKNPMEDMIARARELQKSLQIEVKQHVKNWNERWESYQSIDWDASQIQTNIQLVLQGREPRSLSQPSLTPLQLLPAKE